MVKQRTPQSLRRTAESQRGASLLLALGILSLLVIGAVAWDVTRRTNDAFSAVQLHQTMARQNALTALDEALIALEQSLGRDRNVSARADILPKPKNPLWTVAFPADGEPVYLVTGTPAMDDTMGALTRVFGQDAEQEVVAPVLELVDANGDPAGRMAWWIGDQGIKAQTGQIDSRLSPSLFNDYELSNGFIDAQDLLLQSLPGPANAPEGALSDSGGLLGSHFHDFATYNAFTLTNGLDGGLREDLSALYAPGIEENDFDTPLPRGLKAWMQHVTIPGGVAQPIVSEGLHLQPLVVEFALRCGLAADSNQGGGYPPVIFNYHLFVELWNPYARKLATGDRTVDLVVKVHNLPKVSMPYGSAVLPDPLIIELDAFENMPPGQVQLISSPVREGGTSGTGLWQLEIGTAHAPSATTVRTLAFEAADILVEIFDASRMDAGPVQTVRLSGYDDFSISYPRAMLFQRPATVTTVNGMSREAFDEGGWTFAYHWRMLGNPIDGTLDEWLTRKDPRMREMELRVGSEHPGIDFLEKPYEDYQRESLIPEVDFWASRYSAMFRLWDKNAILFDLPGGELVSLGMLRHHYWEGQAPFALGAPYGGEVNNLLDRVFFSTLPPERGDRPPLNGRIVILDDKEPHVGPATADSLLLEGGFNINSTSIAAWTAILDSLQQERVPVSDNSGAIYDELEMGPRIFNLPHGGNTASSASIASAMETQNPVLFDASNPTVEIERRHPAFLVGVRELSEEQIENLAEAVVTRIRTRGQPFRSLSEFADSGILQAAIDADPSINLRHDGEDRIARNSPASITQGSIIAALAPIIAARSDTFLVRAYGASPRGTAAWLEALVQRMPEATADENDPEDRRRFEVLYLRWLDTEQL